jgi:hypothetical protein
MSLLHQFDELPASQHLEADSVDLNGAAPAPHAAHLSSDRVECEFVKGLAAKSRMEFRRVDLRSQPVDGRRVVGVESVRLEVAAVADEFTRAGRAAGRKQRRDRSRACNDSDEKCYAQRESHGVFCCLGARPAKRDWQDPFGGSVGSPMRIAMVYGHGVRTDWPSTKIRTLSALPLSLPLRRVQGDFRLLVEERQQSAREGTHAMPPALQLASPMHGRPWRRSYCPLVSPLRFAFVLARLCAAIALAPLYFVLLPLHA